MAEPRKIQQGINSIVIGMSVLDVIVDAGGPLSLNAISAQVDMPPAKVHRYLVSLIETGFVERLKEPGLYDLGHKALKIGFKAIQRIDRVGIANDEVVALNTRIDETVFLTIWNDGQVSVVGRKASSRPITLMVRIGEVLSPYYSSVGRLFAAFLPEDEKEKLLKSYATLRKKPKIDGKAVNKTDFILKLDKIRREQFTAATGDFQSNVCSYSVPILNARGEIEFALTVIGYENDIGNPNTDAGLRITQELNNSKEKLREKLGTWEAI